jgi:hypothetical protein
VARLANVDGVGQRVADQVRVQQARDSAELVQPKQVPQKLRTVVQQQSHDVAMADAERPIAVGVTIDDRVRFAVAERLILEAQEYALGIRACVVLELPHQHGVRIGFDQTDALKEANRVRNRVIHLLTSHSSPTDADGGGYAAAN